MMNDFKPDTKSQSLKFIAAFTMLICSIWGNAQSNNPNYDKHLADSLGSDEYGMKRHMQNINRLAESGKLIVAGPLQKNEKTYRGIFILNVKTIEEANGLLETDPAIKAKVLDSEVYGWYGSAALPMYLDFHKKVEKKSF